MRPIIAATLLATLLLVNAIEAKKLKAKNDKLDKNGRPNKKVKAMVESLRQSGRDETEPDGNGNTLKVVRRGKGKGKEMVVEQHFQGLKIFASRIHDEEIEGGAVELKDGKDAGASTVVVDVAPQTLQTGEFFEGLEQDFPNVNKGQLTKLTKQAENKLRKEYQGKKFKIEEVESEPIVYIDRETNEGMLGVYVSLFAYTDDEQARPTVIYDENLDEVLWWNDYQSAYEKVGTGPGGNEKTGKYNYGNGGTKDPFTVNKSGGDCYLETEHFRTYHWITAATANDFSAHKFPCPTQSGDVANGGYSPLNDVHANAEKTFKMLKSWYGAVPFAYLPLQLRAHYGGSFYAGYNPKTGKLNFANGPSSVSYPLTTLGIVAHELGHAVTEYGSATVYNGQSGGLNEAFSDMTAVAALYYNREPVTWKMMDNVFKPTYSRSYIRCMDDPKCDHAFGGKSIDHVSQWSEGMDTHYSSGLFNKVFYLISQTYNAWDAYDIMYAANTKIWTSTTNFLDAASGTLLALEKMKSGVINFGYSYSWIADGEIVAAFNAVGIACTKGEKGWICVNA